MDPSKLSPDYSPSIAAARLRSPLKRSMWAIGLALASLIGGLVFFAFEGPMLSISEPSSTVASTILRTPSAAISDEDQPRPGPEEIASAFRQALEAQQTIVQVVRPQEALEPAAPLITELIPLPKRRPVNRGATEAAPP